MQLTFRVAVVVLGLANLLLAQGGMYGGIPGLVAQGYSGPVGLGHPGDAANTLPVAVSRPALELPLDSGATGASHGASATPSRTHAKSRRGKRAGARGARRGAKRGRVVSLKGWELWWSLEDDFVLATEAERARVKREALTVDAFLGAAIADDIKPVSRLAIQTRIIPTLRHALNDHHPYVRAAAALALGRVTDPEDPESLRLIADRLADRYALVRQWACLGLGLAGGRKEAATLLAIARDDVRARHLLDPHGGSVRPVTRAMACVGIGLIGRRQGSARIAVLLDNLAHLATRSRGDREVAVGAALGFRLMHDHAFAPQLLREIGGSRGDPYANAHLVTALGHRGDARALRPLMLAASTAPMQFRRSTAIALGFIRPDGPKLQVDLLRRLAKGASDRATRNFAIVSLGRLGGAEARGCLQKLLERGQYQDRTFAALGLGIGSYITKTPDKRAIHVVLRHYQDARNHLEKSAHAIALGLLGASLAAPVLRSELATQPDPGLRGHLCTALALLGDAESRPLIRDLFQDAPDPGVRRQAARAMGLLRAPDATPLLVAALRDCRGSPRQIASAITGLGLLRDGAAVVDLVQLARMHPRMEVRTVAIAGLGRLANKEAIPLLTTLRTGTNYLALTQTLYLLLSLV